MPTKVLVPIADGSEEIEAVTVIDTLRRAHANVTVAACTPGERLDVSAAKSTHLVADCHINSCVDEVFNLIAVPGGMPGATNLKNSTPLISLLKQQQELQRWYAAICAAPAIVLAQHGLLDNVRATCYPSFFEQLEGAQIEPGNSVVVDHKNRVITAQGPGCALAFSFALIDAIYGKDAFRAIAKEMLADWAL